MLPIHVSPLLYQGLDALKKAIVSRSLNYHELPHLGFHITPSCIHVLEGILKLRHSGIVVLSWEEYRSLAQPGDGDGVVCERVLEEDTGQLHAVVSH